MARLAAVALLLCGTSALAAPPVFVPRLDAEGFPLPREALRRLGSARFLSPDSNTTIGYTPDGKTLITYGSSVVGWDAITGRARWIYKPVRSYFSNAALSLDGKSVWAVTYSYPQGGSSQQSEAFRISATDGSLLGRVPLETANYGAFLSSSGRIVIQREKQFELVSGETGKRIGSWTAPEVLNFFSQAMVSPDGRRVAFGASHPSASPQGLLQIWIVDLMTGRLEQQLPVGRHSQHENVVIRFGEDSQHLYALVVPGQFMNGLIPDSHLQIWDLQTRSALSEFKITSDLGNGRLAYPNDLSVSPDGKTIAICGFSFPITIYDLPTGKLRRRMPITSWAPPVFDSTDKTMAVSGCAVTQWDTTTGRKLPHSPQPYAIADAGLTFSADGRRLTALPFSKADKVEWDILTGHETARVSCVKTIGSGLLSSTGNIQLASDPVFIQSPDGRTIAHFVFKRGDFANPENGTIILGDARTWKYLRTLPAITNWTQGLAFSPDSRFLMSDASTQVGVYDVIAGKLLHKIATVGHPTNCSYSSPSTGHLYPSPDSRHLAVLEDNSMSSSDGVAQWSQWSIGVYDLPSGKEEKRFKGEGNLLALSWSADGTRLACAGRTHLPQDGKQGILFIGDLTTEYPALNLKRVDKSSNTVALSPDGRTMATADDGGIRLWEVATGKVRHTFVGHRSTPVKLAFSRDGKQLAASAADGLLIWDVAGVLSASKVAVDLERAWAELAGDDASTAFRAVRRLAANPDRSLPFLAKKYADAPPMPDTNRIPTLIRQLDAPGFADREEAQAALVRLGALATKAVRTASESHPSQEVRQRAQRILATPHELTSDHLRAIRVVEVMNRIGTPKAVEQLQRWASGPAWAPLTAEANREAERLTRN